MRPLECTPFVALAAGLLLSACATSTPGVESSTTATPAASSSGGAANSGPPEGALRDLTPQEKKVIIEAIAPSLRNAAAAKYKWAKIPAAPTTDSINYCAMVDAGSPYAAYNGQQAYIIEAKLSGGQVTSAALGLIAGGKDVAIVKGMCSKYGLDPSKAN